MAKRDSISRGKSDSEARVFSVLNHWKQRRTILSVVSTIIPVSYTIHMGAPPYPLRIPSIPPSGQVGVPHEVAVALARGATAFVEGPDHQALPPAAVAGGKDAFEIGGVLLETGFDIGALVAVNAKVLKQRLLGTQKTHSEQDELRRPDLFGPRHFLGHEVAFLVPLPLDLDRADLPPPAVVVADKLRGSGEINARVGS